MSGHTKGPWFVTGSKTKYVEARIDGGLIQEICAVGPTASDGGYGPQQEANARLIAAAPGILIELESLYEELEKYMHTPHPEGVTGAGKYLLKMQDARTAIAKAKGEAQ